MYIYNLHSFKNLEIKPYPHLDWPDLVTTGLLKIRCSESTSVSNIAVSKIAFVLLHQFEMSGSEREFHLPNVGIAYETYTNDTSETRALISEEIDRKRSVVLISCKWYLCSNIRLFALRMLQGARLLPYLLSFYSSLLFASPDGNSLTNLSLFFHLFWIAP